MSFAGLRYYQMTTDSNRAKFMSDAQEKITNFTTPLVFFTLEINRLEDGYLDTRFAQNKELARYKPVFDKIRAMKPYQLSDELENFLHDLVQSALFKDTFRSVGEQHRISIKGEAQLV